MGNALNLETEIVDFFDYFLQIDEPKTVIIGTPTTCGVTDKVVELMLDYFIFEDKSVLVYVNDRYKQQFFMRKIREWFDVNRSSYFHKDIIVHENSYEWNSKTLSVIEPQSEGFMIPVNKKLDVIIIDKDLGEETKFVVENILRPLGDNIFVFTNDFDNSMFYTFDTKYKTLFNNHSHENHRENIDKRLNNGNFLHS